MLSIAIISLPVEGQLEGSIMGGMGQALYEDSTCIDGKKQGKAKGTDSSA